MEVMRYVHLKMRDVILYREHGDILEVGSHDQLMALHGRYEQLYQSQFG